MALAGSIPQHLHEQGQPCHLRRMLHLATLHLGVVLYPVDAFHFPVPPREEIFPCLPVHRQHMGHPFFLSRVIVQGEYLAKYLFPSCRRHGSPVLPAIIPIGPFWHFTGLGQHEQDTVEQAVFLEAFRQQFMHTLGLRGPDDVDARLFNMHRYSVADPCHIQCPAAPCREQLLYELPVGVAVGGVEHAHYLVHQNDHAAGIAVMCQQ